MKIAIIVEGKTEKAFMPHLRNFLKTRLAGSMPKLDPFPYDGRIPKESQLKKDRSKTFAGQTARRPYHCLDRRLYRG